MHQEARLLHTLIFYSVDELIVSVRRISKDKMLLCQWSFFAQKAPPKAFFRFLIAGQLVPMSSVFNVETEA